MKSILISAAAAVSLAAIAVAQDTPALKETKDKVSYSIGANIGQNLREQSLDLNLEPLVRGLKDALAGSTLALTEAEMDQILKAFSGEMQAKQIERMKALGEKNKKEGEAFLVGNKKKTGVKTLASGVQYEVLKEGKGKKPALTDTVTAHYRGTFIDGSEFDSSAKQGMPATFDVTGVIPGWTEILQLMPMGSKWRVFIPGEKAYGEQGRPPVIPPNTTLVFDIELIGIEAAK